MRTSSPSNMVSRMISLVANPQLADGEQIRPAAQVRRIVWTAQAATIRSGLSALATHQIEACVAAELDAMELPEIFFTSVDVGGSVATCDLDASGTASIFGLIEAREYDDLVEEAGEEALLGVDSDGVYVTSARTRH